MEDCKQTPLEDQRKQALEHYEDLSSKACHFSSFVKDAILAYNPTEDKKAHVLETPQELHIAQWVIDNRYPKSEHDKICDFELYSQLAEKIKSHATQQKAQARNEAIQECITAICDNHTDEYGFITMTIKTVEKELSKLKS